MEQKSHRVSAAQFFIAMFVSRVAVTLALNSRYTGGESFLDNIISYLLSMIAAVLITIPIWRLQRKHPGENINEIAVKRMGTTGKLVPVLYVIYFVIANVSSLALFEIFLLDTVNPDFSSAFVIIAMLGVAWYGAWRGIETVSRCATCVFVALLAGCLLVFGIVAGRFKVENLEPLFYNGFGQTVQGIALFLARTSIFADMAILLPQIHGKKKLGFAGWAVGTSVFVCLLLLLLVGCLGRYAYTQNFPVYALASITEVRSLQRLDAVFIGVWMMGIIIKLAVDLYACRVCFSSICKKRRPGMWVTAVALAVLVLSLCVGIGLWQGVFLSVGFLLICTLFTGLLLPLLVLIVDKLFSKKGE